MQQTHAYVTPKDANNHIADEDVLLLQELVRTMAMQGYRFTTVTPKTHERFLARAVGLAKNSSDIFGWNLPFNADTLPPLVLDLLYRGDLISDHRDHLKSKVRISSLRDDLFLHSSFPTDDNDSVFFGPDTYRFARFITQSLKSFQLQRKHPLQILDVGCGSGAGGVAAVRSLPHQLPYQLHLNDINPTALTYASACVQATNIPATLILGDFFTINEPKFDLIVSNPPYISDSAGRLYRDGGRQLGLDLSLRIVRHALQLLAPGGHLLLYTGVAMTNNSNNPLLCELNLPLLGDNFRWSYDEIDPDIFGEELDQPEYRNANRIAAVGLTITKIA